MKYSLAEVAEMYDIYPGILKYARQIAKVKPDGPKYTYSLPKIQRIIDEVNRQGVFKKELLPIEEIIKKEAKK